MARQETELFPLTEALEAIAVSHRRVVAAGNGSGRFSTRCGVSVEAGGVRARRGLRLRRRVDVERSTAAACGSGMVSEGGSGPPSCIRGAGSAGRPVTRWQRGEAPRGRRASPGASPPRSSAEKSSLGDSAPR